MAAARANVSGAPFSEREKALLYRVLPVGIQPRVPLAGQLEVGEVVIQTPLTETKHVYTERPTEPRKRSCTIQQKPPAHFHGAN